MILSYPILFLFTCPSTPAKTGALVRGLIRMILSSPTLFCFTCPSACKNWGFRQGAYTNDPIISYAVLLYLPECLQKLGL